MASSHFAADVCTRCGAVRPLAEFYEEAADWGPGQSGPVCRACRDETKRTYKLPTLVDERAAVPEKFRAAIEAHLAAPPGTPWVKALEAAGLSTHRWSLETILNKSAEARRLYQNLLRDMGMDHPYMAKKLRLNLHAMKPVWNSEEKQFEFFPDYSTQQKALELLHKMHGLLNPPEADGARPPQLVIVTNVGGGGAPRKRDARTFTLDATTGEVTGGDDDEFSV